MNVTQLIQRMSDAIEVYRFTDTYRIGGRHGDF